MKYVYLVKCPVTETYRTFDEKFDAKKFITQQIERWELTPEHFELVELWRGRF